MSTLDKFAYARGAVLPAFEAITLPYEPPNRFAFGIGISKDFHFATGLAQR
jgi:hypothetical protein